MLGDPQPGDVYRQPGLCELPLRRPLPAEAGSSTGRFSTVIGCDGAHLG
jgi:hypothetical protein